MTTRRFAARVLRSSHALAFVALSACGGDDEGPAPAVDAASDAGCNPLSVARFSPMWRPPQITLGSCTDKQIADTFRVCHAPSATTAECTAYSRDPANLRCRSCLYSTEDESAYGPIVILKNRVLTANVAGCLALLDGNLGDAGCGAGLQAFEACKAAVCIPVCTTYEDYQQCTRKAGDAECARYLDDSACADPPTYDFCLRPASFEAYFGIFGDLFCGRGLAPQPHTGRGAVDGQRSVDAGAFGLRSLPWSPRLGVTAIESIDGLETSGLGEAVGP
jgi:hypothetical protein